MDALKVTKETDIREYRRLLMVRLSNKGLTQNEIAEVLDCSQGLFSLTLQSYEEQGRQGLESKPHAGARPALSESDKSALGRGGQGLRFQR